MLYKKSAMVVAFAFQAAVAALIIATSVFGRPALALLNLKRLIPSAWSIGAGATVLLRNTTKRARVLSGQAMMIAPVCCARRRFPLAVSVMVDVDAPGAMVCGRGAQACGWRPRSMTA